MYDLIIQNGECILTDQKGQLKTQQIDIGILHGKIVDIGFLDVKKSRAVMNVKGLTVLPGLIDTQVHFREPGLEHKEDLESGTKGAVLGGITGIFDMPNTKPATVDVESFQDKVRRGQDRCWSNYAFFMGTCSENADQIVHLENLPGCCGVKVFLGSSTGGLLLDRDEDVSRVLKSGYRRVAFHCEDEERMKQRYPIFKDGGSAVYHPIWRDELSALRATERVLNLARDTGRAVHILHVTTAEEMELLKKSKDICTVECTPQHLALCGPEVYEQLGTYAQMNPPIREDRHRQRLWQAVTDGTVDIIGSDHAPHTHEEKARTWPDSPSGMPGVQTTVPLMLDFVNQGRLSLHRFVELMATNPAKFYKIQNKGHIKVGGDADLTIVDMKREQTIEQSWIASRCGWTPFAGRTVKGWPTMTIVGGHTVMREGEVLGTPQGQLMHFARLERN